MGGSFNIVGGGPRTGTAPTRVVDSSERSSQRLGYYLQLRPLTGVDTGAMLTTDLEQAAWDASVMPVSTGTDTDGNSRAVVSVTCENSDGPTTTGVGADGTTSTRAIDSDGGATSEQESSSSRLISVKDSFDIVGGGPRTGASPTRVIDSSERSSEPIDGTVAAESREQEADSQGRSRTPVVWGQGIPLRPAMTIQRITPKRVDKAAQTTSQFLGVQTGILPGHASVTNAVTRLQRERDLALRRVDELHEHYKKELHSKDDDGHRRAQWQKDQHQNQLRTATDATAQYKM